MPDARGKADIADGLRRLGFRAGDRIIVHSSFKSLGPVEGGIEALLAAMMEVIAPEGTIMMPVFTQPTDVWTLDNWNTTTGAVPRVFGRRPDVVRSVHPVHSVAVWGARARELIEGHLEAGGLNVNSPMHKLARMGAKVLNIGTNFTTLSILHVPEFIVKLPFLHVTYAAYDITHNVRMPDGEVVRYREKEFTADSKGFLKAEPFMRARGLVRDGCLLDAKVFTVDALEMIEAGVEVLRNDPTALLCDKPSCKVCPIRREIAKQAGGRPH